MFCERWNQMPIMEIKLNQMYFHYLRCLYLMQIYKHCYFAIWLNLIGNCSNLNAYGFSTVCRGTQIQQHLMLPKHFQLNVSTRELQFTSTAGPTLKVLPAFSANRPSVWIQPGKSFGSKTSVSSSHYSLQLLR